MSRNKQIRTDERMEMGDRIASRLSRIGALAIDLATSFPDDRAGRLVTDQLLRSATAPGAHYEEARGAQSRNDFIYKVSLALKELREATHWLRVVENTSWQTASIESISSEISELIRILAASKRTAQRGDRK